ncbi:hypothetical protein MMB17_10510 [Methylobacterium organophilum]|uniref:hypothetical protein n=1 Tax=Methylobacterium organophilum TaxID=410 RepID=UPI001F138BA4|nr:hypothetical protein [Methylobacterium organophilum]UMY19694.1 hypothetical protein MMB17_10510 [Methylobacterium organophilum]
MASIDQTAAVLHGFIARAERDDFAAVQGAVLEHALAEPDPRARPAALDALLARLSDGIRPDTFSPLQQAFYVAVLAMIERTRDEVGRVAG